MAEDWDVYLCPIDDHLTSVFVDLALHDEAPQAARPWLLRVAVTLRDPGPDGLGIPDEIDSLYAIEDELFQSIAEALPARYVGRTTSQGQRLFCYYAGSADRLAVQVERVRARFSDYSITESIQHDASWSFYFETLYPSDLDLQGIATRRTIDRLEELGEDPHQPREIVHGLSFPSGQAREAFLRQVASEGFACEEFSPRDDEEGMNRFGLRLVRRDPLHLTYVHGLVVDLFLRAASCDGSYDGWEVSPGR